MNKEKSKITSGIKRPFFNLFATFVLCFIAFPSVMVFVLSIAEPLAEIAEDGTEYLPTWIVLPAIGVPTLTCYYINKFMGRKYHRPESRAYNLRIYKQNPIEPAFTDISTEEIYKPKPKKRTTLTVEEVDAIMQEERNWRRLQSGLPAIEYELNRINGMDGIVFENWCVNLLLRSGFETAEQTGKSGDQGVDIVAVKDGLRYAIQCKCYSSPLGNTPVQEVTAGKPFYSCHVGAVMTNSIFTRNAIELAKINGVLLWDRDYIKKLLENEK